MWQSFLYNTFVIHRPQNYVLWLLILLYIAYFAIYSVLKLQNMYAEYFDLGIMHQTVYNTYQGVRTGDMGRILELTDPHGTSNQITRMAIHNDPLLALLAPFYFIHAGPETILILQAAWLALGAWAVLNIAERILERKWIPLAFALAYLMYSPMQWANIFEFHAVTFATTGILYMVYYWMTKRYKLSVLFMVLVLLTKEQVGLSIGVFGLYTAYHAWNTRSSQPKWYAIVVTTTSWGWSLLSAFVIIPFFNAGKHFASGYYDNLIPNIAGRIMSGDTLNYFIYTLGPLAFLTLLAPQFMVIAGPELGINLLSSNEQLRNITFHYLSVIQPWFFVGAIFGFKSLVDHRPKIASIAALSILLASLLFAYLSGPLPFSQNAKIDAWLYDKKEERRTVYKWAKRLNADTIKVSSTDQIAPFFTSRRVFYIFSPNYKHADYVIVSLGNLEYTYRKVVTDPAYESLKKDPNFIKVDEENGFEVYKKRTIR